MRAWFFHSEAWLTIDICLQLWGPAKRGPKNPQPNLPSRSQIFTLPIIVWGGLRILLKSFSSPEFQCELCSQPPSPPADTVTLKQGFHLVYSEDGAFCRELTRMYKWMWTVLRGWWSCLGSSASCSICSGICRVKAHSCHRGSLHTAGEGGST